MKGGIVFDLDGTLIDSAPDIHTATNQILIEDGLAPLDFATVKGFIGKGLPNLVTRVLQTVGRGGNADLHRQYLHRFETIYLTAVGLTQPYPGVRTALQMLADAGHPLGICTNKPIAPTRAVLDHLGLTTIFGAIFGGDSLPQRKPDPAPLHAAFAALGATALLFVGDSEVDCDTALAAKIPLALFTYGYRHTPLAELNHHAAFDHFDQLPEIVEGLGRRK